MADGQDVGRSFDRSAADYDAILAPNRVGAERLVAAIPPGDYPRVLEAAGGRPVLVRGGGRVSDEDVLRRTEALMGVGAAGLVYGRNVIQHERPTALPFLRVL